jgi:hypothetical protein
MLSRLPLCTYVHGVTGRVNLLVESVEMAKSVGIPYPTCFDSITRYFVWGIKNFRICNVCEYPRRSAFLQNV